MKKSVTKLTTTISLSLLLLGKLSYSQHQVSAFAGSSQGFQDGAALTAKFKAPTDICVSPDGNYIYVADYSGNRIRKINKSTNQVSTLAGDGVAGNSDGLGQSARFNFPTGLAISVDGNFLYVADNGNSLIRKIDLSTNNVVTIAGDGDFDHSDNTNGLLAKFNQPTDLALRGDTVLFISDTENHVIRKMNLQTTAVTTVVGYIGIGGFLDGIGTAAAVKNPAGMTISADGSILYLADNGNNMIRKIELPTYNVSVIAGSGMAGFSDNSNGLMADFYAPQGVSIDATANLLYVADTYNHRIREVNLNTAAVVTIAGDGSIPPASTYGNNTNGLLAKFFYPTNCVISPDGQSIYVADQGNFKIREVKTDITINVQPQAANDQTSTSSNTPVTINITSNDTDTDGNLDLSTIDLDPNTAGIQTTFSSAEGTFTVDASGVVTYTPATGFTGTAILYYTINDNNGAVSNVASLTIVVVASNVSPTANDDAVSTSMNTPVSINITSNDTDTDGNLNLSTIDLDPNTAGIQTSFSSAEGTFVVDVSGVVTYTPATGFTGTATLNYTISDNNGAVSNIATLTIVVVSVNSNPSANDDAVSTTVNTSVSINVISNDTDVDGTIDLQSIDLDPNTAGIQTSFSATEGTFTVDASGVVTFIPASGFTGTVTLFYTVSDNNGAVSNVASLVITVTGGTSGVQSLTADNILIYPNPTSQYLIIRSEDISLAATKIISLTGETYSLPFTASDSEILINVSQLPAGKYFVLRTDKNKQLQFYEFIKN